MDIQKLLAVLEVHAVVVANNMDFCGNCGVDFNKSQNETCPRCGTRFGFIIASGLGEIVEAGDRLLRVAQDQPELGLKGLSYIGRDENNSRQLDRFFKMLARSGSYRPDRSPDPTTTANDGNPSERFAGLVSHVAMAHTLIISGEQHSDALKFVCGRCGRERQGRQLSCATCHTRWALVAGDGELFSFGELGSMTTDQRGPLYGMTVTGKAISLGGTSTHVAWRIDQHTIIPYPNLRDLTFFRAW